MANFAKRKNLLFVGGFNHLPNADAAAFADRIVRLYKDDSALKAMVMNSGKLIENYYTVEQALKIISPDFGGRLK